MKKLLLFSFALFAVQFSQAQWEHDFRLTATYDTSFLNYTISHSIATNGDTVHIVWYEKTDDNWEIFYMRSTDGGLNWDPDTRLTFTEEFSKYPSVSVSGSSVYVVWEESMDGNREIFFIRSLDGGTNWEEAVRLTEDPQISYSCVIASNGSYVHVGWVTKDPDQQTWKIYYKHSADGGLNWSAESWLSPYSNKAYAASIAVSNTDVYFAWTDFRDFNLEIYYRKSSDNGMTWGFETRLTSDPALSQMPSIAASGPSVYIAWLDHRSGFNAIYIKCSIDGGENWSEDIQVTKDPSFSFNPNLAYSDSVLHLVYQNTYNGNSDIYYNFSVDGGQTWHEETLLNDFSYISQFPSIAVSGPVLHVIWQDYRDNNYEIYYKQNPTGGMPVGIEDEPLTSSYRQISVYPNPASRQLTVDSWQSTVVSRQSSLRLSIVDLYGREIKAFDNVASFPYQIDISDLRDGVYLLRVADEDGKSGSVKFLKIAE